jgi:hypothetical protein
MCRRSQACTDWRGTQNGAATSAVSTTAPGLDAAWSTRWTRGVWVGEPFAGLSALVANGLIERDIADGAGRTIGIGSGRRPCSGGSWT